MSRLVGFREQPVSIISSASGGEEDHNAFSSDDDDSCSNDYFSSDNNESDNDVTGLARQREREARAADRLSFRLLAVNDDDSVEEDRILRKSLRLLAPVFEEDEMLVFDDDKGAELSSRRFRDQHTWKETIRYEQESAKTRKRVIWTLLTWALAGLAVVVAALVYLGKVVGPPNQPVGPYALIERQEGEDFFPYYSFYEGPDSVGSNGYLNYVSREQAEGRDILNVTYEYDDLDDMFRPSGSSSSSSTEKRTKKPFVYMGSASTEAGPRDSIRLEGNRRFNRGLFM